MFVLAETLHAGKANPKPEYQVSHSEWKSMLLSPCLTPISATMVTLFMGSLGNDMNGCAKRLTVHRKTHPVYLTIELLLS